jgi:hypothetical protein
MNYSRVRFLDTKNRFSGTVTNGKFAIPRVDNVSSFQIDKVSFFNSQYTVDSRNNKIYFNDGSDRTGTVASAQYTGATIATAIQTAMNAASSGYSVSYDSSTNKLTLSHASSFVLTLSNTTNAIWDFIGFATGTDSSSTTSHTSTNQINLTSKYIYMTLDIADNPELSNELPENVALILLNDSSWGSLINYDNPVSIKSNKRNFKFLTYKVYDDRDNIIDANGISFSFRITFS